MSDIIEGTVRDIVNRDTVEVEIENVGLAAADDYAPTEYFRVAEPEVRAETRRKTKADPTDLFAAALQDCRIRCRVEERDENGCLIGDIEVLDIAQENPVAASPDDYIETRSYEDDR